MPSEWPGFLNAIAEETRLFRESSQVPTNLEGDWQAFMQEARECLPGLSIAADKATVCLGELSPGCQACKNGAWDCVFVTQRCNLSCSFCYSPNGVAKDYAGSAFGDSPEEMAANYTRTHIEGISFSGGEPFLEPERLVHWAGFFREHFPQAYLWVYTNGMQVETRRLEMLGEVGVNEIRFNTAASGYDHPRVLAVMRKATSLFPNITVEIPAIPEHTQKLFDCLSMWADLGVRYLNLHELIYEEGTNSENMAGPRQAICLADGHRTAVHPESRRFILEIMERVQRECIPLAVNHCSLPNKLHQIRGRRLSLLPLTKKPYEKLVAGERLESFCLVDSQGQARFVHPDQLAGVWKVSPDQRCMRLERMAPLGVRDPERWVTYEEVCLDA
jgi:pyruvate formate-lyase activating enzyme-like uncharacterized protein